MNRALYALERYLDDMECDTSDFGDLSVSYLMSAFLFHAFLDGENEDINCSKKNEFDTYKNVKFTSARMDENEWEHKINGKLLAFSKNGELHTIGFES